jgi:hypothetical protein
MQMASYGFVREDRVNKFEFLENVTLNESFIIKINRFHGQHEIKPRPSVMKTN